MVAARQPVLDRALAFGLLGTQVGTAGTSAYTKTVQSVAGQQLIDQHYPAGASAPADIITTTATAKKVTTAAHASGVKQLLPLQTSADGHWTLIQAVLASPPDSAAAQATIARLRTATHTVPGSAALVGGQTASLVDTNAANSRDARVVMPLILAVVLVILILLLRALVAPLLLAASVVLSFGAALGAAILIFHAIGYPHIDQGFPLLAYLFLVALGVDYTIFLMTRAREEVASAGHARGVTRALAVTGGVITSAGVVLAATFSALTVLPLVEMLQLGIVVALGVLLDTLIVRTLLVPALAIDAGRRVWWPGRLSRDTPAEAVSARAGAIESVREPDQAR